MNGFIPNILHFSINFSQLYQLVSFPALFPLDCLPACLPACLYVCRCSFTLSAILSPLIIPVSSSLPPGDLRSVQAGDVPPINRNHFEDAFDAVAPSVSPADLQRYIDWNGTFGSFRRMIWANMVQWPLNSSHHWSVEGLQWSARSAVSIPIIMAAMSLFILAITPKCTYH